MKKIGVEPIMTSNTENFFRRSLLLGLKETFPEKPDSFEKVIDFISEKLSL